MKVKNLTIQRFKGLGEMNADQLWETTMNPDDPDARCGWTSTTPATPSTYFTKLMGEKVEPRRDWIKAEARKVQNLDV